MAVTREEVVCAYRFILNREPENDAVIEAHCAAADWTALRDVFMGSDEYRHVQGYLNRWMVAPVFNDTRLLWLNMRDKYVSMHCSADAYDPPNTTLLRRLLRPGDTFLDLGANIGWFTLLASTVVGSSGMVICFEPQPTIAGYLARTVNLNALDDVVSLHRAGVWNEAGSMHLAWSEAAENHGASHLLPSGQSEGSMVPLMTLDSLSLTSCDMIKMDIEGAEAMAMRGADRLLRNARPTILSELSPTHLTDVSGVSANVYVAEMNERGYQCLGAHDDLAGQVIGADRDFAAMFGPHGFTDVLFVPDEKVAAVSDLLFASPV